MSNYTHRVTIACPIEFVPICNQLSGALGLSYADANYFGDVNYQDALGNLYCVRSTACTEEFLLGAAGPDLTRPEWDDEAQQIDMVAAEDAKALLIIENTPALPDFIVAVVDDDPRSALDVLELTIIETPEDL